MVEKPCSWSAVSNKCVLQTTSSVFYGPLKCDLQPPSKKKCCSTPTACSTALSKVTTAPPKKSSAATQQCVLQPSQKWLQPPQKKFCSHPTAYSTAPSKVTVAPQKSAAAPQQCVLQPSHKWPTAPKKVLQPPNFVIQPPKSRTDSGYHSSVYKANRWTQTITWHHTSHYQSREEEYRRSSSSLVQCGASLWANKSQAAFAGAQTRM